MAISLIDICRGSGAGMRAEPVGADGDSASLVGTPLAVARRLGMAAIAGFGILVLLPALAAQAAFAV